MQLFCLKTQSILQKNQKSKCGEPDPYGHQFDLTVGDMVELKVKNFGEEAALALEWVDEAELQEYLARR